MSEVHDAHRHSSRHREQVLSSEVCGCFFCLQTFPPAEIQEWIDEDPGTGIGTTAVCRGAASIPVIGSASGVPITADFLGRMKEHWF